MKKTPMNYTDEDNWWVAVGTAIPASGEETKQPKRIGFAVGEKKKEAPRRIGFTTAGPKS